MQPEVVKMLIKVPSDVRAWLEDQAARNVSSMQAELIRSARARMDQEQQPKKGGAR